MIGDGLIAGATTTKFTFHLCPNRRLHLSSPTLSTKFPSHLKPRNGWVSLWVSSYPGGLFMARATVEDGRRSCSMPEEEEEEEEHKTFYELLRISADGSFSDIKRAYKQLARKYHPDVCPPDRAVEFTRRFIEVQEAYETLSDPGRRAVYDGDLARGLHLAFSARRRSNEGFTERSEWRYRWQNQVAGLKNRSSNKDSRENMSWGARMRRQMEESSTD